MTRYVSDPATLADLPLDEGWPRGGVALAPRPEDEGKPRAVIYARISRDGKGNHLGVRRQIDSVWSMLVRDGFVVVHIYMDNDISAFSGKERPDYEAMMRRVASDAPAVIGAWHTDRLHRNMRNLLDYIDVVKPREVSTRCVSAGVLDLSTASGVMTAQIGAAVATQEVAHLRERILAKKEQQRAGGEWAGGRAPFGFRKNGKASLAVVDDEATAIKAAARYVLNAPDAAVAMLSVAKGWNAKGRRTRGDLAWTVAKVARVLCSPTTAGRIVHQGQDTGEASWPAILDTDKWEGVRAVLNNGEPTRKYRARSTTRLLTGVAVCGKCGAPMRAGRKEANGAHPDGAPIYVCSAAQHTKRLAEVIDDHVAGKVIERLSQPDAVELHTPDRSEEVTDLHTRAAALRARKADLGAAFAAGDIDRDALRAGTERLRTEIAETEDRLSVLSAGSVLDGLAGNPDVVTLWVDLPIEQRRAVVEAVATVTITPGKRGGNPGTRNIGDDVAATVRIEWKGTTPADRV